MSLFKTYKGQEADLEKISLQEGRIYFTEDQNNLYIDVGTNDGDRKQVNANVIQAVEWGSLKDIAEPLIPSGMIVGSTFKFGRYQVESEDPWAIEWEIVHQTDEYQVAQTKQIIDLRCFDAKESNNTDSSRAGSGNNNWQYSNIKQFLNSDKELWYSAQHTYDAPPNSDNVWSNYNPYDTHKGFLYYFSNEEKSLLKDMTFNLANPTVDGGGSYTWTGKVWLPTYTQMSGNQNNSISEGTKFDKYSDDNSRIKTINKYCAENNKYCIDKNKTEGKAWYYWMSSAYPSSSSRACYVASVGGPEDYNTAYGGYYGLTPCICLSLS